MKNKTRTYLGWSLLIIGCLLAWPLVIGGLLAFVIGCLFFIPGLLVLPDNDMRFGDRTIIKREHTLVMKRKGSHDTNDKGRS